MDAPGRAALLRSHAQQKERPWERRRTCFAVASEEIARDGNFRFEKTKKNPRRLGDWGGGEFVAGAHARNGFQERDYKYVLANLAAWSERSPTGGALYLTGDKKWGFSDDLQVSRQLPSGLNLCQQASP